MVLTLTAANADMVDQTAYDTYLGRRQVLKSYLRMKLDEEDWHGVMDAAADLRELDATMHALWPHTR